MTMTAPPEPIYRNAEEALALVLDLAEPARLDLFLQALRARLTPTEPALEAHPALNPSTHP